MSLLVIEKILFMLVFLTSPHIISCIIMSIQECSVMSESMDCSRQITLSVGFSRLEYKSGLPFPPPGDLPNPGTKPVSSALAGRFFATELPEKPNNTYPLIKNQ